MRYCESRVPARAPWWRRRTCALSLWLAAPLALPALAASPPVQLPPATTLEYGLTSGVLSGTGWLDWQPSGGRYTLTLRGTALGLNLLRWTSSGALDAHGLVPEQFSDRRLTQPDRRAEIDRPAGVVRYSGYKPDHAGELPLDGEMQDRLSWMVQLPALLAANPALRDAGQRISFSVTGARRDADRWTFVVKGRQEVALADGRAVDSIYLMRANDAPGATVAEAWLDPARGFLPVRARLTSGDKNDRIDFLLR